MYETKNSNFLLPIEQEDVAIPVILDCDDIDRIRLITGVLAKHGLDYARPVSTLSAVETTFFS